MANGAPFILLPPPGSGKATGAGGMNREEAPGKSPEDMYIQQKVRVLLMLKKMGSNLTPSEEAFLRNYAGVVHSQMSQLPQHNIDQGKFTPPQKDVSRPQQKRIDEDGVAIATSVVPGKLRFPVGFGVAAATCCISRLEQISSWCGIFFAVTSFGRLMSFQEEFTLKGALPQKSRSQRAPNDLNATQKHANFSTPCRGRGDGVLTVRDGGSATVTLGPPHPPHCIPPRPHPAPHVIHNNPNSTNTTLMSSGEEGAPERVRRGGEETPGGGCLAPPPQPLPSLTPPHTSWHTIT
ncbi:hypothetical protein ABVT39_017811 [Epinephelus coioides]